MLRKIVAFISPVSALKKGMLERQPLPMGRKQFMEWSDRIIALAMIDADHESQRFALADMILHLNATEDHKEDGYFVKILRKVAVNQVADAMRKEIRDLAKARLVEAEAQVMSHNTDGEVTPTSEATVNVLEDPKLQAT